MDREEFDKFLEEELQEMSEKIAKGVNPLTGENIDDTDDSDNADGGFGAKELILVKEKLGIDDLDSEPVQAENTVSLFEEDFEGLVEDKGLGR